MEKTIMPFIYGKVEKIFLDFAEQTSGLKLAKFTHSVRVALGLKAKIEEKIREVMGEAGREAAKIADDFLELDVPLNKDKVRWASNKLKANATRITQEFLKNKIVADIFKA